MQEFAFFDLDHTLLTVDSEELWSGFLAEQGWVEAAFVETSERNYQAYQAGRLNFRIYEEFLLAPLARIPLEVLLKLRTEYLQRVRTHIFQKMTERVDRHRAQGDRLVLITAANSFLAEPIGSLLGFVDIICTRAEERDGAFTGGIVGTPVFREAKPQYLQDWIDRQGLSYAGSWGYSDSHNDLPLLFRVDHPVAVRPDPALSAHAREHGWEIILD